MKERKAMYKERHDCRICGGSLTTVIDLGNLHVSTFVESDKEVPKVPMTLMVCKDCELVQLKHTINGDVMYREYWYKSGLNGKMVKALQNVVHSIDELHRVEDSIWVDIGSNDNTLLKYVKEMYKDSVTTVGFDPTLMDRHPVDFFVNDYFNADRYDELLATKADVVTMIACFYDLEDPNGFLTQIKRILRKDGVFVIQMMDLESMWRLRDFANICHEHLEYYSLKVLNNLMNKHGLQIFDVEYNDVNGGSLRAYIQYTTGAPSETVQEALRHEEEYFSSLEPDMFTWFRNEVSSQAHKIHKFFEWAEQTGKTVAVFGASTKGNTILQYYGLDYTVIDHAAEVNSDKFGLKTVGTHIPIVSQVESLKSKPDYYFVLPYGFIDFFIDEHSEYLRTGGKFLVCMPEPAVIWWDGLGAQWTNL